MHSHNQPKTGSPLERAFSGLAAALACAGSFYSLPYIAKNYRYSMYQYLYGVLDTSWAYWGSWAFVLALTACCFFSISAFLQLGVQMVFRRQKPKGRIF